MQSDEHLYAVAAAAAAETELCDLLVDNDDEVAEPGEVTPTSGIIYLATCAATGLQYVGQTKYKLEKRWACHRSKAVCPGPAPKFIQAIREYGADAFNLEILHKVPLAELNALESREICERGTFMKGYNSTSGGSGNTTMAPDVIARRAVTQRGNPHNNINKRMHAEDRDLPKYIRHLRGKVTGYSVCSHPAMGGDSITFTAGGEAAIEENKAKALAALAKVNAEGYKKKYTGLLPECFIERASGCSFSYLGTLHSFTLATNCFSKNLDLAFKEFARLQAAEVARGELDEFDVVQCPTIPEYWYKKRKLKFDETLANIMLDTNISKRRDRLKKAKRDYLEALFDAATLPPEIWTCMSSYYLIVNGQYISVPQEDSGLCKRTIAYNTLAKVLKINVETLRAEYPDTPKIYDHPELCGLYDDNNKHIGYAFTKADFYDHEVTHKNVGMAYALKRTYIDFIIYWKMQEWIAAGLFPEDTQIL